jgi:uncharacterized protein (DUF1800 family)
MGDQNTVLATEAEVRHLLRRTGFGWNAEEVASLSGLTRGAAADRLLAFKPQGFRPSGRDFDKLHNKWVKFMLKTRFGLQEKLVLLWHDHFATGISKVFDAKLMGLQNLLLRKFCRGDFKGLVKAINRDPAMMEWLDTVRNRRNRPNENYARELMELFTLGVHDLTGVENYTQNEVVEIARAFTGWNYEGNKAVFRDFDHDDDEDKIVFTTTGGFGPGGRSITANGVGAGEIDTVIDILFDHRDSQGKNTVARRTAKRLLEYFCHGDFASPGPAQIAVIDQVVADSGFDVTWDLTALLRAIFVHDAFWETLTTAKRSVKWPADFVVTTLRLLALKPKGRDLRIIINNNNSGRSVLQFLSAMGQTLFDPPSVFGWDWESAWISSTTLLSRYRLARDIGNARYGGGSARLRPERLMDMTLTDPGQIVDAAADLLGIGLDAAERTVLATYVGDGNQFASVDLSDFDVRNRKLHGLFVLLVQSPAYQLH